MNQLINELSMNDECVYRTAPGTPGLLNRGLTEENTQLVMISQIGNFKIPIGDVLCNLGLEICSRTLLYLSQKCPISNWVYYPQLGI